MTWSFAFVPVLAWLLAGGAKFAINSLVRRELAFGQIGLGGFPSTHAAVASSPAWAIALSGGAAKPVMALAIGFLLIVIIDAVDTRRRIGELVLVIQSTFPDTPGFQKLRARTGHSPLEVMVGVLVGGAAAALASAIGR